MAVLDKLVEGIVAALMATLVVLVFCAVGFRYVLHDPLTWSEEVGRICLVWLSFLGTYLAHRRAEHIAVSAIVDRLPAKIALLSRLGVTVLFLVFLVFLVWYGGRYAWRFLGSTTPLLDVPLGAIYLAMPLSALLVALNVSIAIPAMLREWRREGRNGPAQP